MYVVSAARSMRAAHYLQSVPHAMFKQSSGHAPLRVPIRQCQRIWDLHTLSGWPCTGPPKTLAPTPQSFSCDFKMRHHVHPLTLAGRAQPFPGKPHWDKLAKHLRTRCKGGKQRPEVAPFDLALRAHWLQPHLHSPHAQLLYALTPCTSPICTHPMRKPRMHEPHTHYP